MLWQLITQRRNKLNNALYRWGFSLTRGKKIPKAKRQLKTAFYPVERTLFSFMKIIGQEALDKWEKEETKKSHKTRYGISITKKRLFTDLYGLNPHEKVVYIGLRLYADREGLCWPSMRTLAEDLNLDKNTIQKYILTLKEKGFLKIKTKRGKGGKRFEYRLLK